MQLKEKKTSMERDKRKLESELEKQRQTIGKQVFLQVVGQKNKQSQPQIQIDHQQQQVLQQQSTPKEITPVSTPVISNQVSTPSPSSVLNNSLKDCGPRRQWDKTQKGFIDLENEQSNPTKSLVDIINDSKQDAQQAVSNTLNTTMILNQSSSLPQAPTSVSSLSTPSSSASQSPPLKNSSPVNDGELDLSKAYYSRDEMSKALKTLKDKYIKESTEADNMAIQASNLLNSSNNASTSSTMVKDIEVLNGKLSELQNEILRLTLLQQKHEPSKPNSFQLNGKSASPETASHINHNNIPIENQNHSQPNSSGSSNHSFSLSEERKNLDDGNKKTEEENNQPGSLINFI